MENQQLSFDVSEKRREVWNAEIEMLEIVKSICERKHIQYFADGGTLLGAIRHKGFIPWDDDLDISMLRTDYERFIEAAKTDLPSGYFLQIPENEKDYFYGHAKIRKNGTTAIRYIQYPENYSHHQGLFIDIFPLDNIPDGAIAHAIHKFISLKLMQLIYYARYYYRRNHHSTVTKLKHRFATILLPNDNSIRFVYKMYNKWIQLANNSNTKRVGPISLYYHMEDKLAIDREWLTTFKTVEFETTEVDIPIEYDKILKRSFGDYMTPVIASSQHGDVFFDLEHDYHEYYNGMRTLQNKSHAL